eukprot:TRINITY_DN53879_c0_g1_i2.p1 TRINITY_DN53879_c0_g1~~TRINITY_DN53879_c0_g1_i2.p1  ORF type:complete len:519 (+),score=8.42 TRINITY_DN53879_c0_g1_i2:16-1572(+)
MPGMFQKIQSHFSETCVSLSRTQIQNSQAFLVMLFADTNQHLQTYTVPNSYYFDSLLHQSTQNISNSQNMTDIQDGRIENVEFYITHSPSFYYDIYVNISNEGTVRTKFIVQIFDGISTRFISDDYIYIDAGEFYNKVVRLSYADQSSYSKVYKVMLFVDDNQFLQSLVVENKKHYQRINNGSMHNIYVSRDAGVCANITNLSNRVATFFLQVKDGQSQFYLGRGETHPLLWDVSEEICVSLEDRELQKISTFDIALFGRDLINEEKPLLQNTTIKNPYNDFVLNGSMSTLYMSDKLDDICARITNYGNITASFILDVDVADDEITVSIDGGDSREQCVNLTSAQLQEHDGVQVDLYVEEPFGDSWSDNKILIQSRNITILESISRALAKSSKSACQSILPSAKRFDGELQSVYNGKQYGLSSDNLCVEIANTGANFGNFRVDFHVQYTLQKRIYVPDMGPGCTDFQCYVPQFEGMSKLVEIDLYEVSFDVEELVDGRKLNNTCDVIACADSTGSNSR